MWNTRNLRSVFTLITLSLLLSEAHGQEGGEGSSGGEKASESPPAEAPTEAPAEEAPAEAPAEEAPAETPAEETPVEAPVEEAPAEAAPPETSGEEAPAETEATSAEARERAAKARARRRRRRRARRKRRAAQAALPKVEVSRQEAAAPPPPTVTEASRLVSLEEALKPQELTPVQPGPALIPPPPLFVEGDLVRVGQIGLLPWEQRAGFSLGIERLGGIYYAAISPGFNQQLKLLGKPLSLTMAVPLRFELLNTLPDERFSNIGRFRSEDWDETSDYGKLIQRLTYGGKEQHFYLDINRYGSHTIGHGTIMKRFDPNLNFNSNRVSLQLDAFSDYVGFESMLNDITGPAIMGGLVFVKPLSFIDRSNFMLRSFSLGAAVVTDQSAPHRNQLDLNDVDEDGRRESELKLATENFQPSAYRIPVVAYGFDAELKLYDKRRFDWKSYLDYSFLSSGLPMEGGDADPTLGGIQQETSSGFTFGHLFRLNLGTDPLHALRIRLEYRNYDPNYLPSYFDTLYEIQRYQYLPRGGVEDLANATRIQRILGRDKTNPRVHGSYFETSWRVGDSFALAMGLELNDQTADNAAFFHIELPRIGDLQFSTSYHRRNMERAGDLFQFGLAENDIWMLQSRYKVASWLYSNFSVMTPFGFGPEAVFQNSLQVNLGVEIGFSYGEKPQTTSSEKADPNQPATAAAASTKSAPAAATEASQSAPSSSPAAPEEVRP